MAKTLHLLIGPKGVGKTHIGTLVEERLGIRFLRVEPIWLALPPGGDGWAAVEAAVDEVLASADDVIIESLGVGEGFERMSRSLATKYRLRFIKVVTDPEECLRRVKTRDARDHIPVSDAKVEEYNRVAVQAVHPWAAIIDNNGPAGEEKILRAFIQ